MAHPFYLFYSLTYTSSIGTWQVQHLRTQEGDSLDSQEAWQESLQKEIDSTALQQYYYS